MPDATLQLAEPRSSQFASRVQTLRTSSGIEAWLIEDHSIPLISMSFAFKGGAGQDPAAKPGVAVTLGGLLDKGAGALGGAAFRQALDDAAIDVGFSVDHDGLHGLLRTSRSARRQAFHLLAMALNSPRFDQDELGRWREQMASALKRELHDSAKVVGRAFRRACYGDHPYGQPISGDLQSLPTIRRDDLLAMHHRTMARDNLRIACVGAVDAAELCEELDRVFGGLPSAAQLTELSSARVNGVGTRQVIPLDVPQSMIQFGREGIGRNDPDRDAAKVVNHCLGAGTFTSRLYREAREKRGLCYSIRTQLLDCDHGSLLVGTTATGNERAVEALDLIDRELKLIAAEGTAAGELERAKRNLIGSHVLQFDTSRKIAHLLCQLQLEGTGIERLDSYTSSIAAVSVEDAARAASRLIGDGDMLVVVAGKPAGL
jgi:zinc protease